MQPRREPLLWLQCLAIGAIPLELLLIRVLLAGADPGPVPVLERLLVWAVGGLAPAVALWRRPADWASLLLLRLPTGSRSKEQLQLSSHQGGFAGKVSLILLTLALFPLFAWLDESAGLVREFSPLQESSRLVSLLLSMPVLALVVWQIQQLVQAIPLLSAGELETAGSESWNAQRLGEERSSFGLQLLQLEPLEWPEVSAGTSESKPSDVVAEVRPEPKTDDQAPSTAVAIEPEPEKQRPMSLQRSNRHRNLNQKPTHPSSALRLRSNQSSREKSKRAPPWMPKSLRETLSPAEKRKSMVNSPRPAEAKRANQTRRRSPRQGVCDSRSNRSRSAGSRDLSAGRWLLKTEEGTSANVKLMLPPM